MYAPRVFVSMLAVLIVFAVSTYSMSGSLLSALIQTLICAVIIQTGYFIGVVYLVHREKLQTQRNTPSDLLLRMNPGQSKGAELHGTTATNFPARDA
ncbi:exopolysaccharide production repressor exox [Rhizobium deserti]|uniref:Exopolysaccharide production repressor exox n=2 Tax=Rhizobium deserti TaxID=2547961 RepID=A0A4R5UPF2_9HYPH|nr:exopolysaccharide production repressor exox [Rhizobium deserti]